MGGTRAMLIMGALLSALGVSAAQAAKWGGTQYVQVYDNKNMSLNGGTGTVYGKPTYAQTFSSNSLHRVYASCDSGPAGWIEKGTNTWAQAICPLRTNGTSGALLIGQGQLYR